MVRNGHFYPTIEGISNVQGSLRGAAGLNVYTRFGFILYCIFLILAVLNFRRVQKEKVGREREWIRTCWHVIQRGVRDETEQFL